MRLTPRALVAVFSAFAVIASHGGELVLAGTHPTSPSTAFPPIHTLKAFNGRIYAGHGDWNYYPAVCIASYDPAIGSWRTEHSPGADSAGTFRAIGNSLYVPSIDPVHFEEFTDFSVLSGGVWRRHAPAGFYHVFDFATITGNDLWMVGAKSRSETANQNASVWRSLDGGTTWSDVTLTNSQARYYYCFTLQGGLYVHDTIYDGTNATRIAAAPYPFFYKPLTVATAAGELVLGLGQQAPGIGSFNRMSMASFDGTNWLEVKTNVVDLTVAGSTVYTLDYNPASQANEIQSADLSAPSIAWTALPLSNVPDGGKAIEVLDGVVYVGDTNGGLWLGRLDGSAITVPPAGIVNELPDGFGRAMAVDDSTLAIGAPEAGGAAIMSGEVTVWTRPARSQPWGQPQVLASPEPSYSGWFGRDVAVANGVMAVLEAGTDTTGRDRGASARIHLYEHDGAAWQWRQMVTHTYAQSITLTSNTLWVAASTVLHRYTVGREPGGASIALAESFASGATSTLYQPSARVAANQTRVAFANTGDFSRSGGPGQVNVYEFDASTWRQVSVLQQTSAPLPSGLVYQPDAFGFAVAMAGDWLAVGAPRDDEAAWQAGAVHLYQRVVIGTSVNYVPRQKIISPVPQQDGWFGSSLALDGDYLVIGHPGFDSAASRREGLVYFYRLAGTNAVAVGQIAAPPASQTEFGVEVALDGKVIMAGSRATAPHADPLARMVARSVIDVVGEAADLVVAGTVAPMQATAGTPVAHTVIVSNAGPSKATGVVIAFTHPTNGTVASVTSSAGGCANNAGVIACTVPEIDPGFTVTLQVTVEPSFSGFCDIMRSGVTASAAEFDPDLRDNELELSVNDFPPYINLLSPVNGTTVRYGTPVQFSAQAAATNGVTQVRFYRNGNILLGSAFSAPYMYTWPQATAGTHAITALVFDQCGEMRTSASVTLVVTSNALPTVSITSPLDRTRYADTNDIQVAVDAFDPDGTVTALRVYAGTNLLRTFSNAPYTFTWTNAPLGAWTLRAVATDNDGGTNASAGVLVVVGNQSQGSGWVAYNDHEAGTGTHTYATRYHIRGDGASGAGALRNVTTGAGLPASVAITRLNLGNISSPGGSPSAGTPAAQAFNGYIDYTTGLYANVPVAVGQSVTYTFAGLNPASLYSLKMTAIRGSSSYTDRWSLMTLNGAQSFRAAHTSGTLTVGTGGLLANQVAINTGFNTAGALADWQDIVPAANGTIAVITTRYTGPIPGGTGTGSTGSYGYAPTMLRLEQTSLTLPTVSTSAVSQTVSPGATPTFNASASGAGPLSYQWYRDGTPIAGATMPTLTLPPVGPEDAGRYNVRITSPDGQAFGQAAILSLFSIRSTLELELSGPIGQRYQIQRRAAFDPGTTWTSVTNMTLPSVPFVFSDPGATNTAQGYYRATPIP